MTDPERPLRLDASREEALEHAARLVVEAWRSFDRFRPEEPPLDERVRRLLEADLPDGAHARPRGTRRRRPDPGRVDRPGAAALLRVHRFERVGDRGRSRTCSRTPTTSTWRSMRVPPRRWKTRRCGGSRSSSDSRRPVGPSPVAGRSATSRHSPRRVSAPYRAHATKGWAGSAWPCTAPRRSTTRSRARSSCSASARTTSTPSPSTGSRRMRPDALAERIDRDVADGITPIAVIATAGTTLTGAVDPFDAIAEVCEARGIWLHVDGAYGLPGCLHATGLARVRGVRARGLLLGGCAQVAVPPQGVRGRVGEGRRGARLGLRARTGLPPAPATRVARRGHHAGVLAAVPRAEAVAGFPRARRGAVPRGDRAQPRRGRPPLSPAPGHRGLRGPRRAAPALDRAVPPRASRRERRERAQRGPGQGDPVRRPRVPRVGAHRRRRLVASMLRELPHDGGRRPGTDRGRAGPGRTARDRGRAA